VVGNVILRRTNVTLTPGTPGPEADAFVQCQPGEKIIGGSANVNVSPQSEILVSRPATDTVGEGGYPADGASFTFWKGTGRNLTGVASQLRVFAICAEAP
jgi:hypothetical protein